MNSSNYRFTLDMQSNQSQVALPVRLGDTNRKLHIILTDGGTPFIIGDGYSAVLVAKKAYDESELVQPCEIRDNSVIYYEFTGATTNVPGVVDCEIRVYDKEQKPVTSPRFIIVVDERVVYDEEILSQYEGTPLDYILGSEQARQFAEAERLLAEEDRKAAENDRLSAETLRKAAEKERLSAEDERKTAEAQRREAEYERQLSAEGMTSVFNLITGKSTAHNVSSLGGIPNYLINNGKALVEGDVLIIAGNGFDFVYMGTPTQGEIDEAKADGRYYTKTDAIFGDLTWEAGKMYVWDDSPNMYKLQVTLEKYNLPVGQEEMNKKLTPLQEGASNAMRGMASGEVVRVDDVSPLEHTVKCRVRSKNLYDNLNNYKNGTCTYSNGTLTVTDRYTHKFIELEEGKTYTFSCKSTRTGVDGGGVHIRAYKEDQRTYVDIQGGSIINLLSPSFTLTMPKGYPYIRIALYGHATSDGTGSATYTELMLEESKEATGYAPYVDATTATVTRCGKNLLDLSRATFTSATYNKDVNGITCKINNSYYSGVRVDYLNDFLLANKGKPLTFSIDSAIDDVLITLLIYGTRTSGKTNQEGSTTGEREISFAISDEFTAITGLEVRVNRKTEAFTDTTTVIRNMQVEVRDTASDFEVYKEATTHTPSADGTVEGIKSVAPTMTLLTDTANVVVEVEYNQDINVLKGKLMEALSAILKIQETLIGGTSQ